MKRIVLGALCGLLAFGARAAWAQEQPEVPPPASLAMKDVIAWGDKYLPDLGSWHLLQVSVAGLVLSSPDEVTLRKDGLAAATIRNEAFHPVDLGPGKMRSDLEHWLVDCRTSRHAVMSMTLYAQNGLKAQYAHREATTPNWLEPGPLDAKATDAICDAIQNGKKLPD